MPQNIRMFTVALVVVVKKLTSIIRNLVKLTIKCNAMQTGMTDKDVCDISSEKTSTCARTPVYLSRRLIPKFLHSEMRYLFSLSYLSKL